MMGSPLGITFLPLLKVVLRENTEPKTKKQSDVLLTPVRIQQKNPHLKKK
jgi:hypothetical protein